MDEELLLLKLQSTIENGKKAPADGYTKPVGNYTVPLGELDGKDEEQQILERAAEPAPANITNRKRTPPTVVNDPDNEPDDDPENKSKENVFIKRIKENPFIFAIIAAILAFFGYSYFKSKQA